MPLSGARCSPAELAKSDANAASRADASAPIPGMSDPVKGKWPLDATDAGLTGISDKDDIALFGGITGFISGALWFITILQKR